MHMREYLQWVNARFWNVGQKQNARGKPTQALGERAKSTLTAPEVGIELGSMTLPAVALLVGRSTLSVSSI